MFISGFVAVFLTLIHLIVFLDLTLKWWLTSNGGENIYKYQTQDSRKNNAKF